MENLRWSTCQSRRGCSRIESVAGSIDAISMQWWKHVPLSPAVSMMSTDKGVRCKRDLR